MLAGVLLATALKQIVAVRGDENEFGWHRVAKSNGTGIVARFAFDPSPQAISDAVKPYLGIHVCNGQGGYLIETFIQLALKDPCMLGVELMVWFAFLALLVVGGGILVLLKLLSDAASPNSETDVKPGDDQIDAMAARLARAKAKGYSARLVLSGPAVICGVALLVFGVLTDLFYSSVNITLVHEYSIPITQLAFATILLALLPTDSKAVKTVALLHAFLLVWDSYSLYGIAMSYKHIKNPRNPVYITYRMYDHGIEACAFFAACLFIMSQVCLCTTRTVLKRTRQVLGVIQLVDLIQIAMQLICKPLLTGAYDWPYKSWAAKCFRVLASVLVMILCFDARVRNWIQELLTSNSEKAMTAAGVSQLLSYGNPADIVATARATFTCVPADRLTREDMVHNIPDARLRALAESAQLGEVDVFLSHSWHDDAEVKWNAIQSWRESFKQIHGREPNFWIDKYCIDQEHIADSLASLPVWLAGCKQIVAFVGNTYLKRLWCVMEIFILVEMQLDNDNFEMVTISDRDALRSDIQSYDISQAQCFAQEDTDRCMRVIDAAGDNVASMLTAFVKKNLDAME